MTIGKNLDPEEIAESLEGAAADMGSSAIAAATVAAQTPKPAETDRPAEEQPEAETDRPAEEQPEAELMNQPEPGLTREQALQEISKLPEMFRSKPDDLQYSEAERAILDRVVDGPAAFNKIGQSTIPTADLSKEGNPQAALQRVVAALQRVVEVGVSNASEEPEADGELDPQFMPGDIVRLRSGGAAMVIDTLSLDKPTKGLNAPERVPAYRWSAICLWFVESEFKRQQIGVEALELVEGAGEDGR